MECNLEFFKRPEFFQILKLHGNITKYSLINLSKRKTSMKNAKFFNVFTNQKKMSNSFLEKFLFIISKNLNDYSIYELREFFINLVKTRYKNRKNSNLLLSIIERTFYMIDGEDYLDEDLKLKKKEKFILYLELIKVPTKKIENIKLKINNTNKKETN